MHFYTIPAGVGDHDSGYSPGNCTEVSFHVYIHQPFVADHCVVLINAMCCASISNKMLCRSCHFVTASAETHKMSKKIRSCSSCSHFNSQGSQITVREGHCICTKIWKCSALWDAVVPEIAALINLLIINWIVCTLAVIVYTVKGSARSFELTNVMLITCSQHTVPPNQQELGLAIHQ